MAEERVRVEERIVEENGNPANQPAIRRQVVRRQQATTIPRGVILVVLLALLGLFLVQHFVLGSGRPALDRFLANAQIGDWNFATLVQAESADQPIPQHEIVKNMQVTVLGERIDWNEDLKVEEFTHQPGLKPGIWVLYSQTGKPNGLTWSFTVPEDMYLIIGGYTVAHNGATYTDGYYTMVAPGTIVNNLFTQDGFRELVNEADAMDEFCYRLAQAQAENWAAKTVIMPVGGSCDGNYAVPVDSGDGGSLPNLNLTPAPTAANGNIAVVPQSATGYTASGCNLRSITNNVVDANPLKNAVTGSVSLNNPTPLTLPFQGKTYNWYSVTVNGVSGWMANTCLSGAGINAPGGNVYVSQPDAATSTASCPANGNGLATGPAILETQVDGVWSVVKLNSGSTYTMPAGACWTMPSQSQLNAEFPGHAERYQANNPGAPSKEM